MVVESSVSQEQRFSRLQQIVERAEHSISPVVKPIDGEFDFRGLASVYAEDLFEYYSLAAISRKPATRGNLEARATRVLFRFRSLLERSLMALSGSH